MNDGVFQETKLTDVSYTWGLNGCRIFTILAPSQHHGGIALFYRDSPNFAVRAILQFGMKVVAFQLATVERRWYIGRCYLDPGDRAKIQDVEVEMNKQPR